MIGLDGSYILKFDIGDRKDFIQENELVQFSIIEEAGYALPTFQLSFNFDDDSLLELLNENNDIALTYGKTLEESVNSTLVPTKIVSNKQGPNKRFVSIIGMYSAQEYANTPNIGISDIKSGVERIIEIAEKTFPAVETNIDISEDQQRWIQYNISDRKHIAEVWLHSYLSESFLAIGVSSDGTFIIKDIVKDLQSDPSWNFMITGANKDTDIVYDTDYTVETNSGFINAWTGYGREKKVYTIEDDSEEDVMEVVIPLVTQTEILSRDQAITKKFDGFALQSDNVHANYWKAHQRNLQYLVAMGGAVLTISFHNVFQPIRILDQVYFSDETIGASGESNEYLTGVYYVSKVTRVINNRQFVTIVKICRESLNAQS